MVYLRCADGITSSATDTNDTNLIGINSRMIREEIDRCAEIFHPYLGRLDTMRITAALTIIGSIKSQCHITEFRQLTGM